MEMASRARAKKTLEATLTEAEDGEDTANMMGDYRSQRRTMEHGERMIAVIAVVVVVVVLVVEVRLKFGQDRSQRNHRD